MSEERHSGDGPECPQCTLRMLSVSNTSTGKIAAGIASRLQAT